MVRHPRKKSATFGDKVKSFFVDTVGGGIKHAWNWVTGGVRNVVRTVHRDAVDLVKGVGHVIDKTQERTAQVLTTTVTSAQRLGSDVSSNISNMAMPLAIGAVAVAAVMIMSK